MGEQLRVFSAVVVIALLVFAASALLDPVQSFSTPGYELAFHGPLPHKNEVARPDGPGGSRAAPAHGRARQPALGMRLALAGALLFLGLSNSLGGVLAAAMLCCVIALHRSAQSAGAWVAAIPAARGSCLASLAAARAVCSTRCWARSERTRRYRRGRRSGLKSMQLVLERPLLGQSIASFWQLDIVRTTGMWFPNAHNGYLELAIELGLVGLSLFLFQLSTTLVRSLAWTPLRDRAALWPYCVAAFVLVYNLWEVATVQESSILWVLYVSASLAVRAPVPRRSQQLAAPASRSLRPTGPSRVAGAERCVSWRSAVALFCVLRHAARHLELLILSLAALVSRWRPPRLQEGADCGRIAVVVPAHDEEGNDRRLCAVAPGGDRGSMASRRFWSMTRTAAPDATAESAKACAPACSCGARPGAGKGFALRAAWQQLRSEGVGALAVVDADTIVEPNFVSEIRRHLRGADAVQVRNLVGNADASVRTRLLALALTRDERGAAARAGTARLVGRSVWQRLRHAARGARAGPVLAEARSRRTSTITFASCTRGRRARFVGLDHGVVEMVTRGGEAASQRIRWEGGRLNLVWGWGPRLVREIAMGRLRLVEPLLDLLTLPLAYHASLLALLAVLPAAPPGSGPRSGSRCSRSTSRSPRDSGASSPT